MINVVTAIFPVESEGFQAIAELRTQPIGKDYVVAEAALLKRAGDKFSLIESFDLGVAGDDTAYGMVMGSFLGILGGPVGVLVGSAAGALAGSTLDRADAIDSISMLEVTASKLYDGDVAVIALVDEEEPAFDAALAKFDATVIRRDAEDVYDEVTRAREVETELARLAFIEMRAEAKAERKALREDRAAAAKARFQQLAADFEARKAADGEAFDKVNEELSAVLREKYADVL